MLPSPQLREISIKDYLVVLRRRVWVILAFFIISTSWSAIKTLKKVPIYKTTAKLFIERSFPQIAPNIQQVYGGPQQYMDKDFVQAQIDILSSRSLAKKVIENLINSGDTSFVGMESPERAFLGGLTVGAQPGTQIISVTYISQDPVRAAKFANILINTYIQEDIDKRISAAKYATGWLDAELVGLKERLAQSETAMSEYLQKNQIVSTPDIERKTETLLEALKHDKINVENEITELSKRYKEKHPKMVGLITKMGAINRSIEDETKKLLSLNQKMIQYGVLKREVDSNKLLYESLLRRIKETEIAENLQTTNIRIIDLADIPRTPFSPNRRQDIMMGAVMGLIFGLGVAVLLEYLDSTIKNAEDVEAYVKLPFLGYVPSVSQEFKIPKDIDLVCYKLPESRAAEAYRSIRTSIIFSTTEDKPLKTILVTSASPQEGKTTVSLNLGIVFASANEKTLIIGADMRKPRIYKTFLMDNKEGLSSFLAGTSTIDSAIKATFIPNLFIMPAGPRPPNPAELLISAKTQILLEEARTKFDRIIVDSPPLLTVADSFILANKVDGTIHVIRASYQNIDLILRSKQRLIEAKARIIGVILNNVDVKKEDSYYYYHYYYAEKKP